MRVDANRYFNPRPLPGRHTNNSATDMQSPNFCAPGALFATGRDHARRLSRKTPCLIQNVAQGANVTINAVIGRDMPPRGRSHESAQGFVPE